MIDPDDQSLRSIETPSLDAYPSIDTTSIITVQINQVSRSSHDCDSIPLLSSNNAGVHAAETNQQQSRGNDASYAENTNQYEEIKHRNDRRPRTGHPMSINLRHESDSRRIINQSSHHEQRRPTSSPVHHSRSVDNLRVQSTRIIPPSASTVANPANSSASSHNKRAAEVLRTNVNLLAAARNVDVRHPDIVTPEKSPPPSPSRQLLRTHSIHTIESETTIPSITSNPVVTITKKKVHLIENITDINDSNLGANTETTNNATGGKPQKSRLVTSTGSRMPRPATATGFRSVEGIAGKAKSKPLKSEASIASSMNEELEKLKDPGHQKSKPSLTFKDLSERDNAALRIGRMIIGSVVNNPEVTTADVISRFFLDNWLSRYGSSSAKADILSVDLLCQLEKYKSITDFIVNTNGADALGGIDSQPANILPDSVVEAHKVMAVVAYGALRKLATEYADSSPVLGEIIQGLQPVLFSKAVSNVDANIFAIPRAPEQEDSSAPLEAPEDLNTWLESAVALSKKVAQLELVLSQAEAQNASLREEVVMLEDTIQLLQDGQINVENLDDVLNQAYAQNDLESVNDPGGAQSSISSARIGMKSSSTGGGDKSDSEEENDDDTVGSKSLPRVASGSNSHLNSRSGSLTSSQIASGMLRSAMRRPTYRGMVSIGNRFKPISKDSATQTEAYAGYKPVPGGPLAQLHETTQSKKSTVELKTLQNVIDVLTAELANMSSQVASSEDYDKLKIEYDAVKQQLLQQESLNRSLNTRIQESTVKQTSLEERYEEERERMNSTIVQLGEHLGNVKITPDENDDVGDHLVVAARELTEKFNARARKRGKLTVSDYLLGLSGALTASIDAGVKNRNELLTRWHMEKLARDRKEKELRLELDNKKRDSLQLKEIITDLESKIFDQKQSYESTIKQLNTKIDHHKSAEEAANRKCEYLEKAVATMRNAMVELEEKFEAKIEVLNEANNDLREMLGFVEQDATVMRELWVASRHRVAVLQKKIEECEEIQRGYLAEIAQLQDEKDAALAEIESLNENLTNANRKIDELTDEIGYMKEDHQNEINCLKTMHAREIDAAGDALKAVQKSLDSTKLALDGWKLKLEASSNDLLIAERRAICLENQIMYNEESIHHLTVAANYTHDRQLELAGELHAQEVALEQAEARAMQAEESEMRVMNRMALILDRQYAKVFNAHVLASRAELSLPLDLRTFDWRVTFGPLVGGQTEAINNGKAVKFDLIPEDDHGEVIISTCFERPSVPVEWSEYRSISDIKPGDYDPNRQIELPPSASPAIKSSKRQTTISGKQDQGGGNSSTRSTLVGVANARASLLSGKKSRKSVRGASGISDDSASDGEPTSIATRKSMLNSEKTPSQIAKRSTRLGKLEEIEGANDRQADVEDEEDENNVDGNNDHEAEQIGNLNSLAASSENTKLSSFKQSLKSMKGITRSTVAVMNGGLSSTKSNSIKSSPADGDSSIGQFPQRVRHLTRVLRKSTLNQNSGQELHNTASMTDSMDLTSEIHEEDLPEGIDEDNNREHFAEDDDIEAPDQEADGNEFASVSSGLTPNETKSSSRAQQLIDPIMRVLGKNEKLITHENAQLRIMLRECVGMLHRIRRGVSDIHRVETALNVTKTALIHVEPSGEKLVDLKSMAEADTLLMEKVWGKISAITSDLQDSMNWIFHHDAFFDKMDDTYDQNDPVEIIAANRRVNLYRQRAKDPELEDECTEDVTEAIRALKHSNHVAMQDYGGWQCALLTVDGKIDLDMPHDGWSRDEKIHILEAKLAFSRRERESYSKEMESEIDRLQNIIRAMLGQRENITEWDMTALCSNLDVETSRARERDLAVYRRIRDAVLSGSVQIDEPLYTDADIKILEAKMKDITARINSLCAANVEVTPGDPINVLSQASKYIPTVSKIVISAHGQTIDPSVRPPVYQSTTQSRPSSSTLPPVHGISTTELQDLGESNRRPYSRPSSAAVPHTNRPSSSNIGAHINDHKVSKSALVPISIAANHGEERTLQGLSRSISLETENQAGLFDEDVDDESEPPAGFESVPLRNSAVRPMRQTVSASAIFEPVVPNPGNEQGFFSSEVAPSTVLSDGAPQTSIILQSPSVPLQSVLQPVSQRPASSGLMPLERRGIPNAKFLPMRSGLDAGKNSVELLGGFEPTLNRKMSLNPNRNLLSVSLPGTGGSSNSMDGLPASGVTPQTQAKSMKEMLGKGDWRQVERDLRREKGLQIVKQRFRESSGHGTIATVGPTLEPTTTLLVPVSNTSRSNVVRPASAAVNSKTATVDLASSIAVDIANIPLRPRSPIVDGNRSVTLGTGVNIAEPSVHPRPGMGVISLHASKALETDRERPHSATYNPEAETKASHASPPVVQGTKSPSRQLPSESSHAQPIAPQKLPPVALQTRTKRILEDLINTCDIIQSRVLFGVRPVPEMILVGDTVGDTSLGKSIELIGAEGNPGIGDSLVEAGRSSSHSRRTKLSHEGHPHHVIGKLDSVAIAPMLSHHSDVHAHSHEIHSISANLYNSHGNRTKLLDNVLPMPTNEPVPRSSLITRHVIPDIVSFADSSHVPRRGDGGYYEELIDTSVDQYFNTRSGAREHHKLTENEIVRYAESLNTKVNQHIAAVQVLENQLMSLGEHYIGNRQEAKLKAERYFKLRTGLPTPCEI